MKICKVKQGSPAWHKLRIGKVTGSRLKQLMSSDNLSLLDILVAEQVTGVSEDSDYVSDDMQRGTDLEPVARKEYEKRTKKKVKLVGFAIHDDYPMFGFSPDGFVGRSGAVEFKCPNTKSHVKTIRRNTIPVQYLHQALCYFLINKSVEWLDFVSYDPRFEVKPIHIIRVTRDDLKEELEEVNEGLRKFFSRFDTIRDSIIF